MIKDIKINIWWDRDDYNKVFTNKLNYELNKP